MEVMLAFAFLVMAGVVVTTVLRQAARGTCQLLSTRNIFLFGLVIAQMTSAALALFTGYHADVPVSEPFATGLRMFLWLTLFLGIFGWIYASGWFTFGLDRRLATRFPVPGSMTMVLLAVVFLCVAAVCRLALVYIPLLGILAGMFGAALAAIATGMVCWAWSRQPANLVMAIIAAAISLAAVSLVLYQAFGRREVVSLLIAALWGAYHGHFKFISWRRAAVPVAVIAGIGLLVSAALTGSRSHDNAKLSFGQMAERLLAANVVAGVADLFSGQHAAANSMFLMETRPESYPYDTLHTLRYAISQPVPRKLWESKPIALGMSMVPEAGITRKGDMFSLGPGLMGHIANDNPWIALPLYAIVFGVIFRVMDMAIWRQPDNPFVVLPIGVALGEVLGLGRGETGLFLFRSMFAVLSTFVGMWVLAKIMLALGFRFRSYEEEVVEGQEPAPPYGQAA